METSKKCRYSCFHSQIGVGWQGSPLQTRAGTWAGECLGPEQSSCGGHGSGGLCYLFLPRGDSCVDSVLLGL